MMVKVEDGKNMFKNFGNFGENANVFTNIYKVEC